jgi:hypothetical protein
MTMFSQRTIAVRGYLELSHLYRKQGGDWSCQGNIQNTNLKVNQRGIAQQ